MRRHSDYIAQMDTAKIRGMEGDGIVEFDLMKQSLLKEEWIDNVKFMTPRSRYNHVELQGELYL